MQIAFVMDPLPSIDPVWETTSHLMYECNQREHTVYFLEPHDIYVRGSRLVARMHDVSTPPDLGMAAYWRTIVDRAKQDDLIFENITDIHALFLRKDPPLMHQTMEFLTPVSDQVFIINSTVGQMVANSKLYLLNFPDIIPETHISRDPGRLKRVIEEFGGDMMVKPLYRFRGEGVIKVSLRDRDNLNSLINYYVKSYKPYTAREAIMVQEYLEVVKTEGDVRIMLLAGEILGAMKRVPAQGDFRTNIHAGATPAKHVVTESDRRICRTIKDRLIADGLWFVGLDVIGDRLVEINVVSPGGIPRINQLDGVKLEARVVDFIEEQVQGLRRGREMAVR
ncbi:MAG: glutathione synthase [Proteobacteria bacterium]|nr:glutathione synthase [Pseudomonadota bacterium]MBU1742375.1 glutathione synthase [Pseudomonadota bacterium]